MGRTAKDSPRPHAQPVKKITLSEKHVGRRLIAAAAFLLIGAGAFAYFIVNLVRGEPGWTEITALSSKVNCSGDFVFLYELGTEGGSAQSEKRSVTAVYTAAAEKAYWMFENVRAEAQDAGAGEAKSKAAAAGPAYVIHGAAVAENADGRIAASAVGSVRYINDHPNEIVTVDEPLYEAFAKLDAAGGRQLYLPAIYETYGNLFASQSDSQAAEFDPRQNESAAAYFKDVLAYANDPASVNLELLGNSQVRLHVSEEYLAFAAENEIDSFIDFYWMKNAFIADYLAEELAAAGCTRGCISSFDGFVRNLDGRNVSYSFNIYDRVAGDGRAEDGRQGGGALTAQADGQSGGTLTAQTDGQDGGTLTAQADGQSGGALTEDAPDTRAAAPVLHLATFQYRGPLSLVYLRDYMTASSDRQYYYPMDDGSTRTAYIDPRDGLCRNSISSLVSYSYDSGLGCADILLAMIPIYIADKFDADAAEALAGDGGGAGSDETSPAGAIFSIYRQGNVIRANDPAAEFSAVSTGYEIGR